MSMSLGKTERVDDDYPAGGTVQHLRYDPITTTPEYVKIYTVSNYPTDNGSWAGTRFGMPGGYPTAQLYGVVQVASIGMIHAPFVCHPAAGFPASPDQVAQCYLNISGGTITQYREDVSWQLTTAAPTAADNPYAIADVTHTHFIGGSVNKWHWLKRTITTVPLSLGVVGLAAIVKDGAGLVARPICVSGGAVALDAGVIRADDFAQALIDWSRGRCFGFEWFLMPGSASIMPEAEGTEAGLDGVLAATSGTNMAYTTINGEQHLQGSAWCAWITYVGCQFTGGRVTFATLTLPSGSRTPEAWPPRQD